VLLGGRHLAAAVDRRAHIPDGGRLMNAGPPPGPGRTAR
jgi:hypothetical protein